jgi:hypothetical protein
MFPDVVGTLSDPHKAHALWVHFPIVLGLLGVIPIAVLAVLRFKSRALSVVCVAWYLGAAAGAGLAAGTGEEAYERVDAYAESIPSADAALEAHEELGEGGWMWPTAVAAIIALTLVPKPAVRVGAGVLAGVAALGVALWVANTAHTGGALVYDYGLGTPATTGAAHNAPAAAHRQDEHDDD